MPFAALIKNLMDQSDIDAPQPWKTLGSTYLIRNRWCVLRQDQVRLPSGKVLDDFYVYEHPDWVNVVAVTPAPDRQVVLVRQYRHGIQESHDELPGGIRDPEDPNDETAARRELLEETGYGGGSWQPWMRLAPNPSSQTNRAHTFLALDVEPVQARTLDESEDMATRLVPIDQISGWIDEGKIVHALHVAPLLKLLADRTRLGI